MILIYRPADGQILTTYDDPIYHPDGIDAFVSHLRDADGHHVCVTDPADPLNKLGHERLYVREDGTLAERVDMPLLIPVSATVAADGVAEFVISGVPAGAIATINGEYAGTVDDGALELTTEQAGPHRVDLRARGFMPATVTFEGVAP